MKKDLIISTIAVIIAAVCLISGFGGISHNRDVQDEFNAIPDAAYNFIIDQLNMSSPDELKVAQIVQYYNTHRVTCDSVVLDDHTRSVLFDKFNSYCGNSANNCEDLDNIWNEIETLPLNELIDMELDVYCEQDWYQHEL